MPSTFHPFPRLPLELRLKIWTLTLPPPHLFVSLNPWSRPGWALLSKSDIRAKIRERRSKSWSSINNQPVPLKRPVPAVLHVCRESRGEFLGGKESAGGGLGGRFVSVNLLGDSVFLDGRRDGLFTCAIHIRMYSLVAPHLQHLLLMVTGMNFSGLGQVVARRYPNLKTVTFILETIEPFGWFNEDYGGLGVRDEVIPEEKGGEVDFEKFGEIRRKRLIWLRSYGERMLVEGGEEYGGLRERGVQVRWRLLEQFGDEVEGIGGWKGVRV